MHNTNLYNHKSINDIDYIIYAVMNTHDQEFLLLYNTRSTCAPDNTAR